MKVTIASVHENVAVYFPTECGEDAIKEQNKYYGCAPNFCGFGVHDELVTQEEANVLLKIVQRGMTYGGSHGGASILDLHSGALSKGDKFVNIFSIIPKSEFLSQEDLRVYAEVKARISHHLVNQFALVTAPYLAQPTFFSRMNSSPPRSVHDEYWHSHVDKVTYATFHYTSLLYLANYEQDFEGGRFVFESPHNTSQTEKWRFIEPKFGRVSYFTSGSEHPHHVEQVRSGVRYALTIPFTCIPEKAIADP